MNNDISGLKINDHSAKKAILFDLDGTLLDRSRSLIDFVTWQVYGMLKNDVDQKQRFIARFLELDAEGLVWKDQVYQTLIEEFNLSNWTVAQLVSSYELCFCVFVLARTGILNMLGQLQQQNKRFALVSNGRSPFQERNFRALGFEHLFDAIIVSQAVGLSKPDPAILKLACEHLAISVSEAVMVGDSIHSDIAAANAIGMSCIYLPCDPTRNCDTANSVCRDIRELPELITKLGC